MSGLEDSLQCYRRTIEIAPKHRLAYNNMALALQDQGKLGEALASLTRQVELAPNFAEAQSARLRCFNFDPKWSDSPPIDWSNLIVSRGGSRDGNQETQTGRDRYEAAPG